MPIAYDDSTGKAYRLNPGTNAWEATSTAENGSTGERFALDGNGWVTVAPATKKPSFEEPVREFFRQNLAAKKPTEAPADGKPQPPDISTMENGEAKPAKGFLENFEAGYQMSTTGLGLRGKMPGLQTPVEADRFEHWANMAGMAVGDIPTAVVGAVAGAAAGTAVAPGPGTLVGGGAGAFALPSALRQSMVDAYTKGEVKSFADYWDRVGNIFMEFGKGGVIGGTTVASGGAVRGGMAASGPVMRETSALAAEITTMVTMGRALEGQVPEPNDFIDAAIMLGGMKTATYTAGKLRTIYAKTGVTPAEVVDHAQRDPALKGEVMARNEEVPAAYKSMAEGTGTPTAKAVKAPKAATVSSEVLAKPVDETVKAPPLPETKPVEALPETPTRGDAEKAVLDRIATSEKPKDPTSFSDMYTAFVDDLHPIKQFRDLLKGDEPMLAKDDPYVAARLTRGSAGKADHFLEYGTFDFNSFQKTGQGLKQVLSPVTGDLDGFKAYAVAARTMELAKRGIESGVPKEDAAAVVASGKGKFAEAFKGLQDYQNGLTKYLKDSGILSKDAVEQMVEANKSYVPFYRLVEEGNSRGPGAGLRVRNPIKAIKGSERKILDPIESIVKNTYLYVALAERNRAMTSMAALAEKSPLGSELMQKVKSTQRPIEVSEPEVAKFLAEHGIEGNAEAFTIFRPTRTPLAPDEIALFRDGKREIYQVAPEVAAAVNKLDRGSLNLVTKILAAPAKMLRAGVTLTPEFAARNFMRDTLMSAILPKYQGIPIYDSLVGLGSVISKDQHYQNWLKSGGANSAMVAIDQNYIEKNIFKLSKDTNLIDNAWNVVRSPIAALRTVSELAENATRLGVYRRATKGADDPNTMAFGGLEAREGTLDFQRIGAKMKAANAITAFLNVGVQGIDRTVQSFRERPAATLLRVGAFITAPSVMLWAANHDDPRYAEIPQWQKDMFWIVMTKDTVYRIPKPFELGILFGSLPERALDAYFGDNPRAFKDFQKTVFEGLLPNYIPTAVQPFVEHWANKSTFTGNPIVPFDVEGELPEYRYQPYTSIAAKKLGQFVAAVPGLGNTSFASPAVIENYVRAWSGGVGAYALQVADEMLVGSGAVEDPVKPAATLSDIPFVKAFVVRHPTAQAQSIQDFMDRYEEKSQVLTTIRKQAQEGNYDAAQKLLVAEEYAADMIKLSGVKEALSQQHRFIRMVYNNKDIKPEEKRQLIDGVYNGMIETARFGNQVLDEYERSVKLVQNP